MPQVNDFSWLNSYFFILFFLLTIVFNLNFVFQLSNKTILKISNFSFNLTISK